MTAFGEFEDPRAFLSRHALRPKDSFGQCFLVAPPVAFLAAFAFFGSPLYRYQAGLHPFMLATIVIACSSLAVSAKRRLPAGFRMRRRLQGYPQNLW